MKSKESVWVVETWDADDHKWYPLYNTGFNLLANAREKCNSIKTMMRTVGEISFKYRVTRYESTK